MATRKPLVRIAGKNQQLPAADSIDVPGARFHEGATEPTIKSYGDRWLDTTSGIGYTWVAPGIWVDLGEPTPADVAAAIHAATSKSTPVDSDELGLADSEASFGLKKLTWANLKAALLAYFKGQFREKLSADRTYYVRTDGSDSNTGLANTSGGAFLTVQKAVDVVSEIDLGGYRATIQIADGTYSSGVVVTYVVNGELILNGNATTPDNVVLSVASGSTITGRNRATFSVENLKVQAAVAGVFADKRATITCKNVTFGACSYAHTAASEGGSVVISTACKIAGNAGSFANLDNGNLNITLAAFTLTGTPAFSTAFIYAQAISYARCVLPTFSGSATGTRYTVITNSVINVNSAGATFLPGNAAGSTSTGGQYL